MNPLAAGDVRELIWAVPMIVGVGLVTFAAVIVSQTRQFMRKMARCRLVPHPPLPGAESQALFGLCRDWASRNGFEFAGWFVIRPQVTSGIHASAALWQRPGVQDMLQYVYAEVSHSDTPKQEASRCTALGGGVQLETDLNRRSRGTLRPPGYLKQHHVGPWTPEDLDRTHQAGLAYLKSRCGMSAAQALEAPDQWESRTGRLLMAWQIRHRFWSIRLLLRSMAWWRRREPLLEDQHARRQVVLPCDAAWPGPPEKLLPSDPGPADDVTD